MGGPLPCDAVVVLLIGLLVGYIPIFGEPCGYEAVFIYPEMLQIETLRFTVSLEVDRKIGFVLGVHRVRYRIFVRFLISEFHAEGR